MPRIVDYIDLVIKNYDNESVINKVKNEVNDFMKNRELFIA